MTPNCAELGECVEGTARRPWGRFAWGLDSAKWSWTCSGCAAYTSAVGDVGNAAGTRSGWIGRTNPCCECSKEWDDGAEVELLRRSSFSESSLSTFTFEFPMLASRRRGFICDMLSSFFTLGWCSETIDVLPLWWNFSSCGVRGDVALLVSLDDEMRILCPLCLASKCRADACVSSRWFTARWTWWSKESTESSLDESPRAGERGLCAVLLTSRVSTWGSCRWTLDTRGTKGGGSVDGRDSVPPWKWVRFLCFARRFWNHTCEGPNNGEKSKQQWDENSSSTKLLKLLMSAKSILGYAVCSVVCHFTSYCCD